jgi:hypothetical protein
MYCCAFAQDSKVDKLQKFDAEKFNRWKFENNFEELDSSMIVFDTMNIEFSDKSNIRVYAPQGNMAPMPSMEIRKDVKYTMQIKDYSNKYPYNTKHFPDSVAPKIRTSLFLKGIKED